MKIRFLLSLCISTFLSFTTYAITDDELKALRASADQRIEKLYQQDSHLKSLKDNDEAEDDESTQESRILVKVKALLATDRAIEKLKDMTKLTVEEQIALTMDERVRLAKEAPAENRYKELEALIANYSVLSIQNSGISTLRLMLASLQKLLHVERGFLDQDNPLLLQIEKLIDFIDPNYIKKFRRLISFQLQSQYLLVAFTDLGLDVHPEEVTSIMSSFQTHWRLTVANARLQDSDLPPSAINLILTSATQVNDLISAFEKAETREQKAEATAAILEIHNALLYHLN